jgi:hypothetical protein
LPGAQLVDGTLSDPLVPGGFPVTSSVFCPTGSTAAAGGYELRFDDPNDASALVGLFETVNGPVTTSSWQVTLLLQTVSRPLIGAVRVQAVATCLGG